MPLGDRSLARLASMAGRTLADRLARRVSVLLVDDIPETRAHVGRMIELDPDLRLVGTAADGPGAIEAAARLRPDVILLDHYMPGLPGIHAASLVLDACPTARLVMMTVEGGAFLIRAAMLAGAVEVLVKPFSLDELRASILAAGAAAPRRPDPARLGVARAKLARWRAAPPGSPVPGLYDDI